MTNPVILKLNSFNARGLANSIKRRTIFNWIKTHHKGITLLQETHSTKSTEKMWLRDWGGEIIFSHGTINSRGVAIMIPNDLNININNLEIDDNGRFISVEASFEGNEIVLVNIYAPTKDHEREQMTFFQYVYDKLMHVADKNLIFGGDFNIVLNPEIDKKVVI